MRLRGLFTALLALSAVWARDWPQMRDEADKGLPPWIQYYDRLKGEPKLGPLDQHLSEPESLNCRLVGKWGRGPAARVTGRDSLVYLALGSEVAVFNCVNAHTPVIVNEIQCRYVVDRPILEDSILYCVLQGGVEVFDVANPASPTRIKYLPITAVDMCINDTMAYTIDADSFKAYRIVAPDSFQLLGACADSGYYIAADSGFAYLCDRWGLYVIDATDPTNPHQVSVLSGGVQTSSVWAESGYCYYSETYPAAAFVVANVSDPHNPSEVGTIPNISVYDTYKSSSFVYLPGFEIIDVSQPSNPAIVGSTTCAGTGVWTRTPYSSSFLADLYNGMASIDISNPVQPVLDTFSAPASGCLGITVSNGLAYLADDFCGLKILTVLPPTSPHEIGSYDTVGQSPQTAAVAVRDSFVYMGWDNLASCFRSVDVSTPINPKLAGTASGFEWGQATLVRDSIAYVAENYHFETYSVANPRNPRLVGSCALPNSSYGLCLRDTLALVGNLTSLRVINIANPASPTVIGVRSMRALGVGVRDTLALVGGDGKLYSVNIANPGAPVEIDSLELDEACYGISINGTKALVGGAGPPNRLCVVDFSNPAEMSCTGYYLTPERVLHVSQQDSLIYAACYSGGVCIFETTGMNAIAEAKPTTPRSPSFELTPNPASSFVDIRLEVKQNTTARNRVKFFDAAGRVVVDVPIVPGRGQQPRSHRIDISALPDGCYFVAVEPSGQGGVQKVVKTGKQ